MSHPLATPRRPDVETLRDVFDSGRSVAKAEVWDRYRMNERRFRAAVSALRASGYPVIADSAEGSTYRKARSAFEAEEFVEHELVSRARSLEEQARAIRDHLAEHFGPAEQLALAIR